MKVLICDLSSLFYPIWHASAGKEISHTYEATISTVRRLAEKFDRAAIACDSGVSFRKAIDPQYKANRPDKDPALLEQIRRVQETLVLDGFPVWAAVGFEADDVIASFVGWAVAQKTPPRVTIASSDKDLCALVEPGVDLMTTKAILNTEGVRAKFGVEPWQIPDYLALVGDSSDNIPGARGIGPKNAAQLLGAFKNLAAILDAARVEQSVDGGPLVKSPAIRTSLLTGAEAILLSRKLVQLRVDVPNIAWTSVLAERVQKPLAAPKGDAWEPEEDQEGFDGAAASPDVACDECGAFVPAVDVCAANGKRGHLACMAPAPGDPSPAAQAPASRRDDGQAPVIALPPREEPAAKPLRMSDVVMSHEAQPEAPRRAPVVSTALAVLDPSDPRYGVALEPRSPREAYELAKCILNSRAFGVPNADFAMAAIMLGRTLGVPAITMCRNVHSYEGKLVLHAHMIIGLVMRAPLCEYFELVESTEESATYATKRRGGSGRETKLTFSVAQAERLGLVRARSNWQVRPGAMCRKQAGVELARAVYPDITSGLYSIEEMGGGTEIIDGEIEGELIETRGAA